MSRRGKIAEPRRKPLAEGATFRSVTFSLYEADVARLDALVAEAIEAGARYPSRSLIVREALKTFDVRTLARTRTAEPLAPSESQEDT